jgi:hypothetical protein
MPATRRLILFIIIILLLLLLFIVVPSVSWSQTPPNPWQDPARELAKKIVALTGPRVTVVLAVRNLSSLSDFEVAAVRLALEAELRAAGLRLADKPDAAPELRITLSENLQGLLWIAEISRDDAREVAMVSLPRTAAPPPTAATPMFVLESKLIYEQDEPILAFAKLDPAIVGGAARLLVLSPARLSLFQFENEQWIILDSVPLPKIFPISRDPRTIFGSGNNFSILLSGAFCNGKAETKLSLKCPGAQSGSAELAEEVESQLAALKSFIAPGRNFFQHNIRDGRGQILRYAQYYSSTNLREGEVNRLVFSNLDGTVSLYASITSPTPTSTYSGWGSALLGIHSACGRRLQLLVTRPGDWTERDAIQAFEIDGTRADAVSLPLSLPGPVIELLRIYVPQSAGAVIRNLTTGRYEAYNLTLSCGR